MQLMKQPPADADVMIECPLCGEEMTYGRARTTKLHPAFGYADGPAALRATAVVECRCGRTAVDIQQRGGMLLAIPRPGRTLAGSSGPDASMIL